MATTLTTQGITFSDGTSITTLGSQSASSAGYRKLPNGIIFQWGSTTLAGGTATLNFPITFPNACLQAVGSSGDNRERIESFSTTQITVASNSGFSVAVRYIAVGY